MKPDYDFSITLVPDQALGGHIYKYELEMLRFTASCLVRAKAVDPERCKAITIDLDDGDWFFTCK